MSINYSVNESIFLYKSHSKESLQRVFNPWRNKIDRDWHPNNIPNDVSILKNSQPTDANCRTHAIKQGSRKLNCIIYTSNGPLETTLPFPVLSSALGLWSERNNCCKFNWLSLPYNRTWRPRGEVEVCLYSFFTPGEETWCPLYGRVCPRACMDRCGKLLPYRFSNHRPPSP